MPYGLGLVNASASHRPEPEHVVRRPGAQPLTKAATPQLRFLGGTYNHLHSSLELRRTYTLWLAVCSWRCLCNPIVDTAPIQLQKVKQNTQRNKPAVTCEDETTAPLMGLQG